MADEIEKQATSARAAAETLQKKQAAAAAAFKVGDTHYI